MIKPTYLWALCKTCQDSKWIGDICRFLGGQDVTLDFGQKQVADMVKMDSDWMDERINWNREAARMRQARAREKRAAEREASREIAEVTRDKRDDEASREITPLSRHPSVHPSIHPSIENIESGGESRAPARTRGDIPDYATVVNAATNMMGIPEWYATWWYGEMNARDWRKTTGGLVGHDNWRPYFKSWWNRATAEEQASIKAEMAAKRKTTEQRDYSARDWELCKERCANCGSNGCTAGIKTPPNATAHPRPPEECAKFKPIGK